MAKPHRFAPAVEHSVWPFSVITSTLLEAGERVTEGLLLLNPYLPREKKPEKCRRQNCFTVDVLIQREN